MLWPEQSASAFVTTEGDDVGQAEAPAERLALMRESFWRVELYR
jgi:hypothetical protein